MNGETGNSRVEWNDWPHRERPSGLPVFIRFDLMLRAVHYVETERMTTQLLAERLEVDPSTLFRLRRAVFEQTGLRLALSRQVRILYVRDFGIFDPDKFLRLAKRYARECEPGGWRTGINKRGARDDE